MTGRDNINLRRFGCTLEPRQNLLCVKWTDLDRAQALAATILVRSIFAKCATGPLLCLALEISPKRALAHYSYFPFNMKNQAHRKYLSSLARTGQLHLSFLAGRKIISRDYLLAPAQCKRVNELYSEVSEVLKSFPTYRFADVVEEFENRFRIPQFFERAVSDNELAESMESLRVKAETVSFEKRALAQKLVHGIAGALKDRYGEKMRKLMTELQDGRMTLMILFDFQREFGNDYDRLVDFVTNGIAVNADDEFLRKSSDWPSKLDSILKFFQQASASPEEKDKVNSEFSAAVGRALNYLSSGRGLSVSLLENLVLPFRPLMPAQAGRPVKNYSAEYALWIGGKKWREVAEHNLQNDPDIREELGRRTFGELSVTERTTLTHRVRIGVAAFAKRTGLSMARNKLLPGPPGEQEKQT